MFAHMEITWRRHHAGQSWQAWQDGYLRGEVVGYGQALRADQPSPASYWVAYVGQERLPGQRTTLEEAKAAVEAALG
jgi:hypothetical protein